MRNLYLLNVFLIFYSILNFLFMLIANGLFCSLNLFSIICFCCVCLSIVSEFANEAHSHSTVKFIFPCFVFITYITHFYEFFKKTTENLILHSLNINLPLLGSQLLQYFFQC